MEQIIFSCQSRIFCLWYNTEILTSFVACYGGRIPHGVEGWREPRKGESFIALRYPVEVQNCAFLVFCNKKVGTGNRSRISIHQNQPWPYTYWHHKYFGSL